MNDKAGVAASQDFGRDEEAAVKALKKHKVYTLQTDIIHICCCIIFTCVLSCLHTRLCSLVDVNR